MKALSIKQPWAWLICIGLKDIENRNWLTKYRGRIYVHAGKWWDATSAGEVWDLINNLHSSYLTEEYFWGWWRRENARTDGKVSETIGEVDIVDCKFRFGEENDNLYSRWHIPGQYGFVLANPKLYDKPIPYKGRLGFFEVELL